MNGLLWFVLLVGVVLAVGLVVGMLVARRIDRRLDRPTAPAEELHDEPHRHD
jgi:uncharacterized protein YneF (UPF0154 family)